MSNKLIDNFDMRTSIPLDKRHSVQNTSDIDLPYEGLRTYQKSDKYFYDYIDGVFIKDIIKDRMTLAENNINSNKNNIEDIFISVKKFGAIGDGVTDDTLAIQTALNTGLSIYFPHGVYRVTSTLNVISSGTRLKGCGKYGILALPLIPNGSIILSEVSVGATIKVSDGLQYVEISDMTITRNNVAVANNSGIDFHGICNLCKVENVEISNHWCGLTLGSTGFSIIKDVFIHDNYSHGVYVENTSTNASIQWQFTGKNLSQLNEGVGFFIHSISNPSNFVTLGNMSGLNTFGNKQGGISFNGSSGTPINGIRLSECFFGEDGNDEIFINSYGTGSHIMNNVYIEACGTASIGRGQSTPATNVGNGINISNCYSLTMSNCAIVNNSYNGILSYCQQLVINGCDIRINGKANVSGTKSGVYVADGKLTMTGCKSMGQQFGVFLVADNDHLIVGNRLEENTQNGLACGTTISTTIHLGNVGE